MDTIQYTYRKSILRKPVTYTLTDRGLLITSIEFKDKITPYLDIKALRFEYLPNNRYDTNRYSCTVYTIDNNEYQILSTTYAGIANFESQAASYLIFVKALLSLVRNANPNSIIYNGQTNFKYFGNMVFIILTFLLFFVFLSYLPISSSSSSSIIFKLILVGFYSFYLVISFKKNYPRKLKNDQEIDEKVLPKINE